MKDLNLLSKHEMKKVLGGGCPAWLQAQCLAEAGSQPSSGDPVEDQVLFDLYLSVCIEKGNTNSINEAS